MAELFIAKESGRGESIVIKRILPYLSQEQEFVKMFLDEARIAAQLHHSNIITVHELGKLEDSIFLAMELVEGVDLRKILQQETKRGNNVPCNIAAYVTAQVCAGLFYAHNATGIDGRALGLVHRDISPQNVMVAYDGRVKIVDFGIAKAGSFMEQSKPGVIKGKFLYLSPEQLSQDKLDGRADLFAIGTMLYEVTTGKSPFHKTTTEAVIYAIRAEDPPAPATLRPDYPEALSQIIMKCLQKDRTRRFQHAADVQHELEDYLSAAGGMDEQGLSQYVSRLFNVHPEPTTPGRDPERTSPERTGPVSGAGRRITKEITGAIQGDDPRTQMASPADLLARSQGAARTSQPVVKPPVRRSGSNYVQVGGDDATTTDSTSAEKSQPTPSDQGLSPEPATRQDRPGEPVFDSFVGRSPARKATRNASAEHATDGGETSAFDGTTVPVWRRPWVLGIAAFGLVALVGVGILGVVQTKPTDLEDRDPHPIHLQSQRAPDPTPPPATEKPPAPVPVEHAAVPEAPSPAASDAGAHLTTSPHPNPPAPPRPRHAVLVFSAPSGTKIYVEKKQVAPGHKVTVPAGALKYEYICPGKRQAQTKALHAPPSEKAQTIAIQCRR